MQTMTHTTNPRPIQTRRLVVLALAGAVALGACGEDGESSSTTTAAKSSSSDPSESEYCATAHEWAVHELDPRDDSDPAVLRAFIGEELDFFDRASAAAPDSLVDEWKASSDGYKSMVVPVLEKYDFDIRHVMNQGTPEEQALDQPPPDIAKAQATIREYGRSPAAPARPEPADIEFAGPPAETYCEAAGMLDSAFGEALERGGLAGRDGAAAHERRPSRADVRHRVRRARRDQGRRGRPQRMGSREEDPAHRSLQLRHPPAHPRGLRVRASDPAVDRPRDPQSLRPRRPTGSSCAWARDPATVTPPCGGR